MRTRWRWQWQWRWRKFRLLSYDSVTWVCSLRLRESTLSLFGVTNNICSRCHIGLPTYIIFLQQQTNILGSFRCSNKQQPNICTLKSQLVFPISYLYTYINMYVCIFTTPTNIRVVSRFVFVCQSLLPATHRPAPNGYSHSLIVSQSHFDITFVGMCIDGCCMCICSAQLCPRLAAAFVLFILISFLANFDCILNEMAILLGGGVALKSLRLLSISRWCCIYYWLLFLFS